MDTAVTADGLRRKPAISRRSMANSVSTSHQRFFPVSLHLLDVRAAGFPSVVSTCQPGSDDMESFSACQADSSC
ncbi:hypothetical protein LHK_02749 [Laribacter hongkongensis HLHK9]|uniref:Uncharacterized protein n=1 Tax=Laribacter hongkongensis (strain HLHK9) TaxID=557598 RepID=C1DD98_LARHH|nr:hypothetical protein LHK_02749 [Laribacter hongkongensis HLHK9]